MLRDLRSRWQCRVLDSELADGTKVTLCRLREFMDRDGRAWPSYGTLAKQTRQERRSVIRQIREAELAGLLTVERGSRSNLYQAVLADTGMVTDGSPTVVTQRSPGVVTVERGDGDSRVQKLVTGGSPEISKRNTPRNGETRTATRIAARSPAQEPVPLPGRLGKIAARIGERFETRRAASGKTGLEPAPGCDSPHDARQIAQAIDPAQPGPGLPNQGRDFATEARASRGR